MKQMILGVLVFLAFATAASAQVEEGTSGARFQAAYDSAPVDGCGAIDASKPCYASVGTYVSCTAKGSADQMCTKLFIENNVAWCTWVAANASCHCDAARKKTEGICSYYR